PVAEVLAEPLRWPTYRVMPKPWSRLNSTVSTSPWRTVVDKPWPTDTATSQALAPWRRASARDSSTWACKVGSACGPITSVALITTPVAYAAGNDGLPLTAALTGSRYRLLLSWRRFPLDPPHV